MSAATRRNAGGTAGARALVPEIRGRGPFCLDERRTAMAKTERKPDHGDEALYALRHSTAHVMAGAVLELFPDAKFGFGPPVADGFYYDFDLPRALTDEDLPRIEERMRAMAKRDVPFEHREMPVPEALDFFRERHQDYKVEQIEKLDKADEQVELRNGSVSIVREELENWWRKVHRERGYTLVYTPHIAHEKIYQRSGHLEKYGENMYGPLLLDDSAGATGGQRPPARFWIKPMNCPGHIKVFQSKIHSYRELPLRIGELGTVYRYERGGTLHGMLRVRGFTQDDSHIFCSWDQAQVEIGKVFDLAMEFLETFGYRDPRVYLAPRPERRLGTDEQWDKAEKALAHARGVREVPYDVDEGGGVFYAPKIDIKVMDAIGREWQGPTIQIDLNLPERFDVTFVNEKGERERAVMIHRVLFGSLERFVGGLIEHYAGNFPLWLNWEQAAIIPVRESARPYAEELATALRGAGLPVHLDAQAGDLRTRIKEAQQRKASYLLVVGDKEAAARTVSVRRRGAAQGEEERGVKLDELIARLVKERDTKALPPDFGPHGPSVGDSLGGGAPSR